MSCGGYLGQVPQMNGCGELAYRCGGCMLPHGQCICRCVRTDHPYRGHTCRCDGSVYPCGRRLYPHEATVCPHRRQSYSQGETVHPYEVIAYSYWGPTYPRREIAYLEVSMHPREQTVHPSEKPTHLRDETVAPNGEYKSPRGELTHRPVDIAEPHEAYFQMANAVRLQAMNNYYGHNPYQLPALPMPMYPYMAGSPYTEGSSSSSNAMSPSLAFRGVQMPSVVNTPALMPSSGMSQMVLPRMNAYFTTGMPMPVPCGCLARAESFPAMCQQMYASHYHMHQHPVGNAQITLPTSEAVPPPPPSSVYSSSAGTSNQVMDSNQITSTNQSTSNGQTTNNNEGNSQNQTDNSNAPADQPTSSNATAAEMPALPPTLAAPPLRSAAMRNKRPAIRFSGQVAVNRDDDPSSVVRSTKRERSASAHSEQSADSVVDIPNSPNSSIIILHGGRNEDEGRARRPTGSIRAIGRSMMDATRHGTRGRQRSRQDTVSRSRRQNTESSVLPVRRPRENINPTHNDLLSSRMAQMESQRQANTAWYRRHHMSADSLVGADVVGRRAVGPSRLSISSYATPLFELSMALLHGELNGAMADNPHTSNDPPPIGASLEQIVELTTVRSYDHDKAIPDTERDRCTVCLMNFEVEDSIRVLPCTHYFHTGCIDRWLIYNKKCPMCRVDIDAVESEDD
uniref:E3 ubiquitin-protein ligase Arkadia n=1 Tax=Ascaris suum TaxID=6253 RepID=F1KYG1_ASCSU